MTKPVAQRLEENHIPVPESGCWLWLGALSHNGYGLINVNGKTARTHRVSFELANNGIPEGLYVLHRCDVRSCINPDHLYAGTNSDNMQDREARGRSNIQKGTKHYNAKLTAKQVEEIRGSQLIQAEIAEQYGVTQAAVSLIKANKNWKH